jgi:hypothetical protein
MKLRGSATQFKIFYLNPKGKNIGTVTLMLFWISEAWSFVILGESRNRMFESKILRKITVPKKREET